MINATQRFFSYEIGKGNINSLRNVFVMSLNIHFLIAIIILILLETLGIWFINNQLNFPNERMLIINWVYQISIFTVLINILSIPFNSLIIANEKIGIFSFFSFIEIVLKLIFVLIIQWINYDKLILYSLSLLLVTIIIRVIYAIYCMYNFNESKYYFYWDKVYFKNLIGFAGWSLWGNMALVATTQGINILLNIFFGPIVNAARGISYQVKSILIQISDNLMTAVNPQIIKAYANNNTDYMHKLIYYSSKYSFLMIMLISLPLFLETELFLKLWLKIVPEHSATFTRLIIISILIDSISGPLITASQATGKIKIYQLVVGGILLLNLPLSYFLFKIYKLPEIAFYVSIMISLVAFFARLILIKKLINISIIKMFRISILVPLIIFLLLLLFYLILITIQLPHFYVTIILCIINILLIFFIGLNKYEKSFIKSIVYSN